MKSKSSTLTCVQRIAVTPKTFVRTEVLKEYKGGYYLRKMNNNFVFKQNENDKDYEKRVEDYAISSWQELISVLRPNMLYLYLHETRVSEFSNPIYNEIDTPGHVALFVTDKEGQICNDTETSFRRDELLKNQDRGFFSTKAHVEGRVRTAIIGTSKFLSIRAELTKQFFSQPVFHQTNLDQARYLIGIPDINEKYLTEISETLKVAKALFPYYILFYGEPTSKFSTEVLENIQFIPTDDKTANCINVLLFVLRYQGTMKNPRTATSIWAVLGAIMGEQPRDEFLRDTNLEKTSQKEERIVVAKDDSYSTLSRKIK